jgi:hypothetical protein
MIRHEERKTQEEENKIEERDRKNFQKSRGQKSKIKLKNVGELK